MTENGHAVSETAAHAAHEVRVVYSRLRRRLRETYDRADLTPSQTSVLSRLDKDGEASVVDLAAAEGVRHQSVASTVGALVERGLAGRRRDPEDGRRQLVYVTDTGHAFLEERRSAGEGWLARALEEQCTEEERQALLAATAVLERIVNS
ncbi:MarR family winged helix-turn-helix transcriptional regulator [Streptomyces sp. SID9124]|uniref:MarR family winged helix-turn-helix transcriptional regulator n=1 Tax=Streptomyces sp. SID9124 TaxID=2706108 RepID=UPI0013E02D48|nr:MarR family winged helix-turn-helix transcriptional regulator [Streptomyces sp. SID9124]NED13956.1 winged helix-turn-helix transcriptional regulator [Streptomyces sp. SID9124]